MKMEMSGQMRMEQRMKLAPLMIQSMEILQLPILALQARIEQELNSNPVLELVESAEGEPNDSAPETLEGIVEEKAPDAVADKDKTADFENLDNQYRDYMEQAGSLRSRIYSSDEPDKKLEAMQNTAAPAQSLHDYLIEQWQMIDTSPEVKKAGEMIIDYIDDKGYLSVRLEQLYNKDRTDFTVEDLYKALALVQKLEPAGVGARDLRECLLIQMAQSSDDMSFESRLVAEHMDDLLNNHLPEIARKMNCDIEAIKHAIERLSKLDTSPGLQIGRDTNHPVTPDIIVESSEVPGEYSVRLADSSVPALRVSPYYVKMAKDTNTNEKTKQFLLNNLRSAQWIINAVEQRNSTLLKVAQSIVRHQKDFLDKGQLYLRPLPMSKVAEEVGVHLATVSRAVSDKYMLCSWGILPLRKFFSGGREDTSGEAHSWEAIRGKLQQIIDQEDKTRPLNDDLIRKKLAEAGIDNLARRTIAKYRKIMNIPAARFRKKF
jgi:RNA polymerase sigma-54 factor